MNAEILHQLKEAIHPRILSALRAEYGSLAGALAHFQKRFGAYAPAIMAGRAPAFFDPIVIKPLAGRGGLDFFDEFLARPWSLSQPRPGSMADLLTKYGLLVRHKGDYKLCLSDPRPAEGGKGVAQMEKAS